MMNVELDLDVYDYCLGHCFKRDSGFFFFFLLLLMLFCLVLLYGMEHVNE